jgi:filamentous hemagglutinin
VLTGDKETGLTPLFNAAKVKDEVQAQVAITAEFGKNASKAWGDYATNKEKELRNQGKNEEADKWREGGTYRAAGHFAIGGLGGGGAGALASGGISLAADSLNSLQGELKDKLIELGLSPDAAQMFSQGAGMATAGTLGTAAGGTVGGGSAFNTDTSNRQLHPTEKQIIRNELAKKMAKDKGISEAQAVARLEAQLLRQVDATAASTGSSDPEAALYINSYKAAHQGQSVGTDQWGNSVPLFGAVGYQRQDSTIFSANPQTTKPPANVGFGQVGDYLGGMAKGVLQGVKDTVNALLHPIDTVNNLIDAASDLTGTGQKIQQKAGDAINAAQDGNTGPAGELVGEQMGASTAGNAIGAGVGKVVTMVKVASKNGTTGGKTTPSDVNANPSASQDVAHSTPNAEQAAAPTQSQSPSATVATTTTSHGSNGTNSTPPDVNGNPSAARQSEPTEAGRTNSGPARVEDGATPYSSTAMRADLEAKYGADNVSSTTVANDPIQRVNSNPAKGVEVISNNSGKAVIVKYNDPITGQESIANIPYDSRGLPIFDDAAKFTTKIDTSVPYGKQFSKATADLRDEINSGRIDGNQFNADQLARIQAGSDKIPGYTWHHNGQSAPNNMQLIPDAVHGQVTHLGQGSLSGGK